MQTDDATRTARTSSIGPPTRASTRRPITWMTALVLGLAVGGLAVGIISSNELSDREAALVAARSDLDRTTAQVDALEADLATVDAGAARLERRLARAQARLDVMVGPTLPDGRHFGYLKAVGADQAPLRVVFDLAQWFSGPDADAAAIADGAMPPGEIHVPNDFYIRNESPRWRTVEVDLGATVSLVTYPYGDIDHPRVVSLDRFATIAGEDPTLVRWSPFWLVVRNGVVQALEQQYIP